MQKASAHVEAKFAHERQTLDALYRELKVGETRRDFGAKKMAEIMGSTQNKVDAAIREFDTSGILKREMKYEPGEGRINVQRTWYYTLLVPHTEAIRILDESQQLRRDRAIASRIEGGKKLSAKRAGVPLGPRTPKANGVHPDEGALVTLAVKDTEETRAIAGPEVDKTLRPVMREAALAVNRQADAPEALVAAARQYRSRSKVIDQKLAEFQKMAAELGISFDREAMLASFQFERDDFLEAISLVIPYIDALDARVTRLAQQVADGREKIQAHETLLHENRKLREQNQRLISEKVSATAKSNQTVVSSGPPR